MMEAYLDESGIHGGAPVCVVAGYFGRRNHWGHFETAWIDALSRYGYRTEDFHAKNWIRSREKRPLLTELARAIGKYSIYPISMGIVVEDFNSFSLAQRRWLTGATARKGKLITSGCPAKPYFVPFQLCLMKITDYLKPGSRAQFFFGLDRTFGEYAGALFRQAKAKSKDNSHSQWKKKDRLGDIAFPMASATPQLQAADLLSYLTYLHMCERLKSTKVPLKPSRLLALCLKNTRYQDDHGFQEKTCLLATLEKARVAARSQN